MTASAHSVREALRGKPWSYVFGTVRYWQILGQSYAEMIAGVAPLVAGGVVGGAASFLGIGRWGAVGIGLSIIVLRILLAVGFGCLVWRHKIIQHTADKEWQNDPWRRRMLELQEVIALRGRPRGKGSSGAVVS